ncbi:unnamed protein product [Chrysodeixis includens]|uniref:Uncharacterized protein n=1 Tax=Chrysodeixis includens TaxID=689277 RepID=A0A9P0BSC3_CHRIL|nr:unnamed protein product [Chrysodeixis includens]
MRKTKSDLSYYSREARRKKDRFKSSGPPIIPNGGVKLSAELLKQEREMNDAIYEEIIAKYKEQVKTKRQKFTEVKPKLRTQPPRYAISLQNNSQLSNMKESPQTVEYNNFCEPPPLLEPLKSVPSKILTKEAKRNERAASIVARKKRVELRADTKKSEFQDNELILEQCQIKPDPECVNLLETID